MGQKKAACYVKNNFTYEKKKEDFVLLPNPFEYSQMYM